MAAKTYAIGDPEVLKVFAERLGRIFENRTGKPRVFDTVPMEAAERLWGERWRQSRIPFQRARELNDAVIDWFVEHPEASSISETDLKAAIDLILDRGGYVM